MRKWLISVTALPLTLAGCAVGPTYEEPQVDLPEEWPDQVLLSEEERAEWSGWWQRFDDPQLEALVERALDDNLNVRLQLQRIREARASLGLADAERMPTLDGQAEATREREPTSSTEIGGQSVDIGGSLNNQFSVTGMLGYEVDLWGSAARRSEAAAAALQESVFSHDAVRLNVVTDVVATYMDLRAAQQSLDITERTLESRAETMRLEQVRFEGGETDELSVRQARSELEATRALLPQQRQRVDQLKNALAVLVGMTPRELMGDLNFGDSRLSDVTLPDEVPEVLPSDLLQRRPDIRAAEAGLIAANAEIGQAQAARLPNLNLTAFGGSAAIDSSDLFSGDAETWGVGASVMGPIFDFGRNKARVNTAEALRDQAETQYRVTVAEAFREVRDALIIYETTDERVERLRDQVRALEGTLRLAQLRYDEGLTDFLAVQDTQRALLNAELTLTEAIRDRLNATATLFKAMGGGWEGEPQSSESET